jgi:cellobiose phosphorylase
MPAEGGRILEGIYHQSQDFTRSRMYPGLPEYFNPRGRGMYPFLTGSASWYLLTLLTEVYGVKGRFGDLVLAPRFTAGSFTGGEVLKVQTAFAGKTLEIEYQNPKRLSCGKYRISSVEINGQHRAVAADAREIIFPRREVVSWPEPAHIVVQLGEESEV